jgi:hypothetical protein
MRARPAQDLGWPCDQQLRALSNEFPRFYRYALIMEEASEAERDKASQPKPAQAIVAAWWQSGPFRDLSGKMRPKVGSSYCKEQCACSNFFGWPTNKSGKNGCMRTQLM